MFEVNETYGLLFELQEKLCWSLVVSLLLEQYAIGFRLQKIYV